LIDYFLENIHLQMRMLYREEHEFWTLILKLICFESRKTPYSHRFFPVPLLPSRKKFRC
jgi:hypothetical protein